MIGFSFSPEQLRSAPAEVRRWAEREIAAGLAQIAGSPGDAAPVHAPTLAACMPDEAAQIFDLVKGDFLLSQVFFDLGHESPLAHGTPPLHAVGVDDVLRHTRIAGVDRLGQYFGAIDQAFRAIRNDPEATLFAFDQQGGVYIHEATCRSIRQLWERLFAAPAASAGGELGGGQLADGPMPGGFAAPHVGPSEAVATHRPAAGGLAG